MEETFSTTTNTTNPYNDDMESTHSSACSTPYVSAPSSPGRSGGGNYYYYYSAPASPMHYLLSSTISHQQQIPFSKSEKPTSPFDNNFDFAGSTSLSGPMSSADELFFNGQIRPMKLSSHLQRPQMLAPLIDVDENDNDQEIEISDIDDLGNPRGRDTIKLRSKSLRRTRSMSPLRSSSTSSFDWQEEEDDFVCNDEEVVVQDQENGVVDCNEEGGKIEEDDKLSDAVQCDSGSSSRSSSVGRSSKRWVLLKEFLYRSKSEGRNNGHKFWNNLSFSPVLKEKQKLEKTEVKEVKMKSSSSNNNNGGAEQVKKKRVNGVMGKKRVGMPSAHEMHYTANRAQAEEMRKKTFLPYRQGLLGCLGFSSRSYGAWNGFTRALNPVSST